MSNKPINMLVVTLSAHKGDPLLKCEIKNPPQDVVDENPKYIGVIMRAFKEALENIIMEIDKEYGDIIQKYTKDIDVQELNRNNVTLFPTKGGKNVH